ncbi:5-nucleotidase, lipoprotein e(P4) family [Mizugakiibacter sediminis]|uniref:5-nucleotidase, lipoprotein e(P4) family n=1 Tax=Mizugakiibacter sediminis TaxID=1475481 RepID=A0A0K8QIX1_9GAMM|nr:HAD family acid phosphatase [Mizugakiibacter sediminis]GAP64793.1 5-nucleotidase, lipoprotein e(P4) family [Mizugakiibacter sediminis]
MRRCRSVLLLSVLLAGCAAAPSKPTPAPAPSAAVPADDNLNAVVWAQTAVEHDLVYREVYRDAEEKLAAALADPAWDALPRGERGNDDAGLPPAVILDIDETVLDNSPYQARLIRDGKEFDEYSWAQWCREGIARPLPGALEFTRHAAAHGVAVFYLSNRSQDLNAATLANLRKDGFPVAGDDRFLGLGTFVPGCEQVGSEKGCRRRLIARRYRVLMQFGDQLGDFLDVLDNTPNGRAAAVRPYLDWIGQRWFVLPNPTYGAWEPALFGNDGALPLPQRRAAKRAALRVQ